MFFGPCPSVTLHSSSTKNNKIQGFLLTPATLFWGDSSSERAVMSHSPPPQTNPTQLERISLSGISKYWTIGQHNWKICLWKYHEGGNEKYRRWKWEIQVENHEKMKWGLGGWRSEDWAGDMNAQLQQHWVKCGNSHWCQSTLRSVWTQKAPIQHRVSQNGWAGSPQSQICLF